MHLNENIFIHEKSHTITSLIALELTIYPVDDDALEEGEDEERNACTVTVHQV